MEFGQVARACADDLMRLRFLVAPPGGGTPALTAAADGLVGAHPLGLQLWSTVKRAKDLVAAGGTQGQLDTLAGAVKASRVFAMAAHPEAAGARAATIDPAARRAGIDGVDRAIAALEQLASGGTRTRPYEVGTVESERVARNALLHRVLEQADAIPVDDIDALAGAGTTLAESARIASGGVPRSSASNELVRHLSDAIAEGGYPAEGRVTLASVQLIAKAVGGVRLELSDLQAAIARTNRV